jgi:hypothetical protein
MEWYIKSSEPLYARAEPTVVEVDCSLVRTSLSAAKSNTFGSVANVIVVVASVSLRPLVCAVQVAECVFREDGLPACVPPEIHAWTRGLVGVGT